MSTILKALRKLEEEKAWRREGSLDLARDVLRQPLRRRSGFRPMKVILPAALLLIAAFGYGLSSLLAPAPPIDPPLAPFQGEEKPALAATGEMSAPIVSPPAIEKEPAIIEEVFNPGKPAGIPDKKRSGRIAAVPTPAAPSGPTAVSHEMSRPHPSAAGAVAPNTALASPSTTAAPLPEVKESRPPLVVSGIAFQDDPQARLAIVNGLPVMAGTVIEGAAVVEILRDGVRFTRAGRTFEIHLEN